MTEPQPQPIRVKLKSAEELEHDAELKRAYERGYEDGIKSRTSAAGEAVLELLHNHYMKLYEVRRPTNSGEQMSVPAKIFLSVAQRCTAEGIAELRQQGSDKKE